MRAVVTGGGTGGHIYPALAVAEFLANEPDMAAVSYIGKTGGLESELAGAANIPFIGIPFYGMPRTKSPMLAVHLLKWFLALAQARSNAIRHLKTLRPDVIFGTGGYVSAPVLLAAKALKIPYAVHEPDAQPGLANRLLARSADLISTSFSEGAEKLRHSPKQTVLVTGNPIRSEIGTLDRDTAKSHLQDFLGHNWPTDRLVVLVTGGSQGSRKINMAVVQALPDLLDDLSVAVIHLTGRKLYDETLSALDQRRPDLRNHPAYRVAPFHTEMGALQALSNLAVCRAGSLSLSEMYVSGLPTILIPYPFAASDHQRKNAQASVRSGASRYLEDNDCTGEKLLMELRTLITDPVLRDTMGKAALSLGHPDATREIAKALKHLAQDAH